MCDVVIAIDWPRAEASARALATELGVASLGWGSRFGADFAPQFLVPDPADQSLPSGVSMYAAPLSSGLRADAMPPLVILLGPITPLTRVVADAAVSAGVPCLVEATSAWATLASLAPVRAIATTLGAFIDAIHDGVDPSAPPVTHAPATPAAVRIAHEPPRVAIVIPTYNRAAYLAAAIDSAIGQTYPNIEIVVANDGSTDDTAAVIASRTGPRVRAITKPHTNGPDTRNHALATVDAPYILWLGDDDLLTPECVASRVAMLTQHPDADVIYGDLIQVDANLEPTGTIIRTEDWAGRSGALLATLFERNPITEGGALVRHAAIKRVGGYDPAFPKAHDYEFWTRLAPTGQFRRDPTIAYIWRWHGGNMGLGSGHNPYQDAHVRIVLGLLSRHAPQDLFPQVPWSQFDAISSQGVGAMLSAVRLWREDAIDFALQFAQRAVECWDVPESRKVLQQLQAAQQQRLATPALAHV